MAIKTGKEFKPDPALKKLYYTYNFFVFVPFLLWIVPMLLLAPPLLNALITFPILVCFLLIFYWIPLYYESIFYTVGKKELVAKRGVWFRKTSIVPYKKITNIDITQGPVSRAFGVSSIKVQTAGYSAASATPVEIRMEGITKPEELKKAIMKFIK